MAKVRAAEAALENPLCLGDLCLGEQASVIFFNQINVVLTSVVALFPKCSKNLYKRSS